MGPKSLIIAALALAGLVCLGIAQTTNPPAKKWEAPPDASTKPNPEAKNPDAAATGHKLYMRTCVGCHEEDGSGKDTGAANLRSPEVQAQSDGALFWKISNGNSEAGMPSFASLPETDRWDVVTFLRTLKDAEGSGSQGSGESKKEPQREPKNERR
ncbi:MAG TPA: c-type cytochrome [Terriglobales bacterium]|nr:c-type cytochrome [Terriglobales bacterium]